MIYNFNEKGVRLLHIYSTTKGMYSPKILKTDEWFLSFTNTHETLEKSFMWYLV